MATQDAEFWRRARQARDKLAAQLLYHPQVSLIDIGYDLGATGDQGTNQVVLRVHVRRPAGQQELSLPEEVDGVPVRIVVADYREE